MYIIIIILTPSVLDPRFLGSLSFVCKLSLGFGTDSTFFFLDLFLSQDFFSLGIFSLDFFLFHLLSIHWSLYIGLRSVGSVSVSRGSALYRQVCIHGRYPWKVP